MAGRREGDGTRTARPLWRRPAALAAIVLLLALLAGWLVGSPIARRVVIAELERRFAADVAIGSLSYLPPYWVVARDVALTTDLAGEKVDWITVPLLEARLDWLPFGRDGVRFADLTLHDPSATFVAVPDGVRDPFELWHGVGLETMELPVGRVDVAGARIVYLDRATAGAKAAPIELGGYNFNLVAADAERRSFSVTLAGGNPRLEASGNGTLDLHQRTLAIAQLDARARLIGSGEDPSPAETAAQAELRDGSGTIALDASTAQVSGGTLLLGAEPPLAVDALHGSLALRSGELDASGLTARVAGGTVQGDVTVRWKDAAGWKASGQVADLDLAGLAKQFPQALGRNVQGRISGTGWFSGGLTFTTAAMLDSLQGAGSGRARQGRFYEVPLVARLLAAAHLGTDSLTLSDAAATFRVAGRKVHFDNAALGSPTIGVQGHGDVDFTGNLSLQMVVVPLGSWKAELQRKKVPLVGDALASLAGSVQSLFGRASAAIYEFEVTGTLQAPRYTPVPVPALTRDAARVFGRMASVGWDGDVLGGDTR